MGTAELPDCVAALDDDDCAKLANMNNELVNRALIELYHRRQQVEDLLLIGDELAANLRLAKRGFPRQESGRSAQE